MVLKRKARKIRRLGIYFPMMLWWLRYYFVATDNPIMKHHLPLFNSFTVGGTLTEVTKKMLEATRAKAWKTTQG